MVVGNRRPADNLLYLSRSYTGIQLFGYAQMHLPDRVCTAQSNNTLDKAGLIASASVYSTSRCLVRNMLLCQVGGLACKVTEALRRALICELQTWKVTPRAVPRSSLYTSAWLLTCFGVSGWRRRRARARSGSGRTRKDSMSQASESHGTKSCGSHP